MFVCALLVAVIANGLTPVPSGFTPGNLVLSRVGSGTGSLVATGNPVFLDEYTTAGVFVHTVALPTAPSGSNKAFYLSGTATSEGFLTRSTDGQYLVITGYATSDGTTNLPGATATAVNRVVARVTATGAIDTTTSLSDFASGGNPRSVATNDGTAFWVAGSTNGERYALLGATSSTSISTTVTNLRVTQIFNGQLYASDASGSAVRLGAIGSGVSTATGQTLVNLPGVPATGGSPYGYFFADLDAGTPGVDTLYIADDGGQILKYSLVGGSWTANGTIAAAGVRGLTGSVSGSTVTLYGVTGASGGASSSKLYRFVDSTGYNATVSGTVTTLVTDVANTAFRGIAFAPGSAGVVVPAVQSTAPANSAVGVSPTTTIGINFNTPVTVTGSWFSINGSTSGAHAATVTGGPASYTLTPVFAFNEGEVVTVTVFASQVVDASTGTQHPVADYTFSFTTLTSTPVAIHTVQGTGTASPYVGQLVTIQGIVTANFQSGLGGFYVQAAEADYDADPATSEGIFVFNSTLTVSPGDVVKLTGTVSEFGTAPTTETELTGIINATTLSTGAPLPSPVAVTLPFPTSTYGERYEGMRVTMPQTLTVTDNFDLGTFGEIEISNGRLATPTNIVAPGAPAIALEAANALNQFILDDGSSPSFPDPTPDLADSAGRGLTRRTGSTVTGITGIMAEKFGLRFVEPTAPVTFTDANPRGDSPVVGGAMRVCIGNIENFMNGNGNGSDGAAGGYPTSRGATNLTEFQRQIAKVTAGILNLAPDIMGLTEVENDRVTNGQPDSYGPTSAIAALVNSLNASAPSGTTYAFINAAAVDIVTDDIHCAFIYRVEKVAPVGLPAMLGGPAFDNVARNPLAQTFRQISTGEKFTACINHFRAKGSAAAGAGNADSGDGQGTNNALRLQEANAVTAWLATDPTGSGDPDFLIIGDLNAYAKEDPIQAILGAGYVSLTETYEGAGGYSYSFNGEFGHLDHALATPHLAAQVVGAATWHVNADEPTYYDYNLENKSVAQQAINVGTPYRYSDHDPVVTGVTLHADDTTPPVINSVTASPNTLGLPLGQTVNVTVTVNATDNVDPAPVSTIIGVTSNQAIIPGTDYVITGPLTVSLRAITTGGPGSARTYTLTVQCRDASGNTSTGMVLVSASPAPLPPRGR